MNVLNLRQLGEDVGELLQFVTAQIYDCQSTGTTESIRQASYAIISQIEDGERGQS